jgi:dihydromethanopterin reductase (acceptor)
MSNPVQKQRLAWAITGSGHYLRECLDIIHTLQDVDLFLSKVPVELFYQGRYHSLVIAPATSNTIAKMVCGISDNLVTNLYAQAGKTRIPSILFACDTAPELESEAPRDKVVKVYPRRIDLENVAKIKTFEATTVVEDMQSLSAQIQARMQAVI